MPDLEIGQWVRCWAIPHAIGKILKVQASPYNPDVYIVSVKFRDKSENELYIYRGNIEVISEDMAAMYMLAH